MTWFDRLARLPLVVETVTTERLEAVVATRGFVRATTVVRLEGAGRVGVGEDVALPLAEHAGIPPAATVPLVGRWRLGDWLEAVDAAAACSCASPRAAAVRSRGWAIESAGLDLALRQARTTVGSLLGLRPRPVRFVASLRLGDPPDLTHVHARRARQPGTELKLDPTPSWDRGVIGALAATGAVRIVDLKGHYAGTMVDQPRDVELYERCLVGLPDALVEDPVVDDETLRLLAPHAGRITWDMAVGDVADLDDLPWRPAGVNVKPSRLGGVRALFALLERCRTEGVPTYGGGMFELGPGRAQLQALAALFHPDGPNDLAPPAYNATSLPAALPPSPLAPRTGGSGLAPDGP